MSEEFKQRQATYRKQLTRQMIFADSIDLRDPQLATEYASEIYKNMRREE